MVRARSSAIYASNGCRDSEPALIHRRRFLASSAAAAVAARAAAAPLRIGHRQASMGVNPGPGVFDLARRIPGLSGVELQVHFKGTTLWDRETLLQYRAASRRSGIKIPSLAGLWAKGVSILRPEPAEDNLRKAIHSAEALGAAVLLAAAFDKNCPDMQDESFYGPVVSLLQKVAPAAEAAGVTVCLETSLSPAEDSRLIDLVDRSAVKVYYDADNCERFGHAGQGLAGFAALGKARLGQVHLKNENRLLEEPGRVDWAAALKALKRIGYDGWMVFESSHTGAEQCIEATAKNIAFIRRHWA